MKIRFEEYDSNNNPVPSTSFAICLKILPYDATSVTIEIPLFNFQITSAAERLPEIQTELESCNAC